MEISCLLELNESGHRFEGHVLIKAAQDGTTSGGSPFLNITIGKQHKTVACKLWENNFNGHAVTDLKAIFQVGQLMYISGNSSEYRGDLQLTIDSFRSIEDGEVDITHFLESAPEPMEELQLEFEQFLDDIESEIIQTVCKDLYEEHKESFLTFPAGKSNHHAFRSGLLYHVVSMLRIAKHLSTQYKELNRDLVYAGIALHDLGKVVELTGYLAPDYTKVGNLLGHITIVNMFVDRKVQKLKEDKERWTRADFEKVYELMHVISAHHGKLEFGSPVTPKILEAEIIHHIDMIDSRINMITKGLADESLTSQDPKKIFPLGLFYKTSST